MTPCALADEAPDGKEAAELRGSSTSIDDPGDALQVLLGASVVVGLHPDQATEPAIDHALRLRVPFAVVPCCVYSLEFPKRHLKESPAKPVTSYDDFLQYLCEKDDGIRMETLPFEGKNTILWYDPDSP